MGLTFNPFTGKLDYTGNTGLGATGATGAAGWIIVAYKNIALVTLGGVCISVVAVSLKTK